MFHNNLCLQNYFNNMSQKSIKITQVLHSFDIYIANTTFHKTDKGLEFKFSPQTRILCPQKYLKCAHYKLTNLQSRKNNN